MSTSALVVGATGLVGGQCVDLLLADRDFDPVAVLTRRPLSGRGDGSRPVTRLANFDRLGDHPDWFRVDQIFCALGTTIRKAGSQEAFRKVDFEYPFEIARLAQAQGARHFLLVSATGADPSSRVFYSRVKGELEVAILGLGFRSVTIARPSFLLGEREEFRMGEAIGKRLGVLLPARYRPVQARQVAAVLIAAARADQPGVHVLENIELRATRT